MNGMLKSQESCMKPKSNVILVSPRDKCTKPNSQNPTTIFTTSHSSKIEEDSSKTESLVGVDRKISLLEWIVLITAPIVNPVIGIVMIFVGIRYVKQKKNCNRDQALSSKILILGLAQWAYRLSVTIAILALALILLYRLDRFPGLWIF